MINADLPRENIYGHTKKLRFILDRIDKCIAEHTNAVTVLDFGCGNGNAVGRYIAERPVVYYGVDFHEPSLQYARSRFGSASAQFLNQVPGGVVFDAIVYSDVLEHLPDPTRVLRAHSSQLRLAGLVIGSVPNGYGPFENEKRIVRWLGVSAALAVASGIWKRIRGGSRQLPVDIPYNMESGHLQFFTKRRLIRTLETCGLSLETFENGAFVGAPVSEVFLLKGEAVARMNTRLADLLPSWAVSTWYFTATKGVLPSA